ncbi:MAG: hypothetical protein GFH27_549297n253 [Chloroflexi bacterium AL-W]|nr:hypothetical protein [Chloroflexi bacterium AL-N1]NOK68894.1 hypothetical protein [Chloroflexi bacterium AL-N10]NOK76877.1 hypothetical protein [Chloroflexi bacterium AL-N5]NOK82735.1 hypothetical protein [Chloroflexi bacterium AL-W]NOK90734.1 hypothetical protein [Chloroflexi bacterium AL-N15]
MKETTVTPVTELISKINEALESENNENQLQIEDFSIEELNPLPLALLQYESSPALT